MVDTAKLDKLITEIMRKYKKPSRRTKAKGSLKIKGFEIVVM